MAIPTPEPTLVPPVLPPPSRRQLRRWAAPLAALDAVATSLDRLRGRLIARVAETSWAVLHVLGAHHWREGWETNLERGWRQYRGSRCAICDVPWEGW